ncbi:MAG: PEP-CTERM sorting domain-containing protein [Akkermansiaceae bacterium]
MKKTIINLIGLGLIGGVNAAVIAPTSITGTIAGDAGSSVGDLISGSGLSAGLTGGETLATAQATTHVLTGGGHTDSWTFGTTGGNPVFSIDLGSELSFGTIILWQYGNNGGPTATDAGNHTREFELIFHTAAEGSTFDFGTEAVEYSGTMSYIDAGGDDSSATNLGQAFQFASVDAQYVGLRIVSNYGGQPGITAGGDRYGLGEVRFATEAVPEPSSTALLGLGGIALLLRRRK